MRRRLVMAALALGAALSSAASAHDFFLLPAQFKADRAGLIIIQATVGSHFPTPEITVAPELAERVTALGPGKPRVRVAGPGDKALNLEVTGARRGLLAVGVSARPRDVDYGEDRIGLILGEYRLSPAAAALVEALPRPRTWNVTSRRFAKTVVCVHTCGDRSAARRAFRAPLEFVEIGPVDNRFQLIAGGKPLAGYPVDLVGPDGSRRHLTTDQHGAVHVPAGVRGTMMLFAALLEPPAGKGRFTLDLTSLTFSRT